MPAVEEAVTFACAGSQLVGIIHRPDGKCRYGVLVVVGGPQYRVGSHRQFTLLARRLASEGIAVMRFDYRGMGDSEGDTRSFENIGDDIRAAVDEFLYRVEDVESVVIWGLCDAASAAIFYAPSDPRVGGLVLLNPWVRTESGEARTYIRHYYAKRVFAGDLWGKVIRGEFDWRSSLTSLVDMVNKSLRWENTGKGLSGSPGGDVLPARMCKHLVRFGKPVLVILSGDHDYVAVEFRDVIRKSVCWKRVLERTLVTKRELAEANHTFSSAQWRGRVESWTLEWMAQLPVR